MHYVVVHWGRCISPNEPLLYNVHINCISKEPPHIPMNQNISSMSHFVSPVSHFISITSHHISHVSKYIPPRWANLLFESQYDPYEPPRLLINSKQLKLEPLHLSFEPPHLSFEPLHVSFEPPHLSNKLKHLALWLTTYRIWATIHYLYTVQCSIQYIPQWTTT